MFHRQLLLTHAPSLATSLPFVIAVLCALMLTVTGPHCRERREHQPAGNAREAEGEGADRRQDPLTGAPGDAARWPDLRQASGPVPGSSRIQAWIGTRDVIRHFKRSGRTWTASIPRAGLSSGPNRLLVQAWVSRPGARPRARPSCWVSARAGLIRRLRAPSLRAALRNGPGSVRHYVPKRGTVLVAIRASRPTRAVLRINGRVVADPTRTMFTRTHSWNASVRDGVRSGVNRIDVRALTPPAASAPDLDVPRPRALPLVEAGGAVRTDRGRWTTLTARGSRPSPGGKGVSTRGVSSPSRRALSRSCGTRRARRRGSSLTSVGTTRLR